MEFNEQEYLTHSEKEEMDKLLSIIQDSPDQDEIQKAQKKLNQLKSKALDRFRAS